MKSLKIAIIAWSLQISGGGARQLLELAINLQEMGNEVDVFCVNADREKCFPHLISRLKVYALSDTQRRQTHILANYGIADKIKYSYTHFRNKKHNLVSLKNLIQDYDNKKNYDIFNYHETEVYKLVEYFPKDKNFWMLNDIILGKETPLESVYQRFTNYVFRLKYRQRIRSIIVLDNYNKKLAKKFLNAKAEVVRSGIDPHSFFTKRKYSENGKSYKILATGIFFPHRRFEDLVLAVKILVGNNITNVRVVIIGSQDTDKKYSKYISDLVKENHLDTYFNFLGRVSENTLVDSYRTSDIFVFPNSPQTWGLSVFEAMLSGEIAIVSKGAGAHEVLTDNKNALLVNPYAPGEIASKIEFIINNPESAKKIAISGQKFVKNNFSWRKYAEGMYSIFSS